MHLCGKINRQTNRPTNKHLRLDCVDKPGGPALKGPSLARSVRKPLKVSSLARSVPKPLSIFASLVVDSECGTTPPSQL